MAETKRASAGGDTRMGGQTAVARVTGGADALAIPLDVLRQIAAPERVLVTARLDAHGVRAHVRGVAVFGGAGGEASGYVEVPSDDEDLAAIAAALGRLAERYKVEALGRAMGNAYKAREVALTPRPAPTTEEGE